MKETDGDEVDGWGVHRSSPPLPALPSPFFSFFLLYYVKMADLGVFHLKGPRSGSFSDRTRTHARAAATLLTEQALNFPLSLPPFFFFNFFSIFFLSFHFLNLPQTHTNILKLIKRLL